MFSVHGWILINALEIPFRMQRKHQPFGRLVRFELLVRGQKFLNSFHWTRTEIRQNRMAIDIGVLHDQIASD